MHHRIKVIGKLKEYLQDGGEEWSMAKQRALQENGWFTAENIDLAIAHIASQFLDEDKLRSWWQAYSAPSKLHHVGIVMAGNIPLVGFHDFLCLYMSGHFGQIKLSSKDSALFTHLFSVLKTWDTTLETRIQLVDKLKDCDAYIATGSNNSARYFEYYFGKKPHLIRRNRTSVAVLEGNETDAELQALGDDVFTYFGLGCRNVTQILLPHGYDFGSLMRAFAPYEHLLNHHKYKNNFDYHLAIYLLNRVPCLTNDALLLIENELPFSAVSVLHYQFYNRVQEAYASLANNPHIQCVVGRQGIPFGRSQMPALSDYADGVDTMAFLCGL